MRENENVRVFGDGVLLVPYESYHVEKYHGWMESEELRKLTASERLPLEKEFEMQERWRKDDDKCTFIILHRSTYDQSLETDQMTKEIISMVGDVNIFYECESTDRTEGEVEIMIAESQARGQGLGKEAVCSMMKYAQTNLGTSKFTCKIGMDNKPSLRLFDSIGFKEISRSDVFEEITLALDATEPDIFHPWTPSYRIEIIKK